MRTSQTIGAVLAATIVLHGCGTAPLDASGRPMTLADAGPAPSDPLAIAQAAILPTLKDPESARFQLPTPPRKVVFAKAGMVQGGAGWEICAAVNAKNSFGGYTGFRRIFILWNAGRIIDYVDGDLGDAYCNDRNDYRLQVEG